MRFFLSILCSLLLVGSAFAAVTGNNIITPQAPNRGYWAFSTGDTQNAFNVAYTAGTNGSRCNAAVATSNDPSFGHQLTWRIYHSTAILFTVTVNVPANIGYLGPTYPLMGPTLTTGLPVDAYGNQYFTLNSGDTIAVAYNGSLASGIGLFAYFNCEDF